ncbi:MAG: hypothetical protein LBH56_00010 [Coriobacteriales bacterium]|jgi:hypothetical protein|nr:hypothetical protein [Coriobacteriales bacterium]
MGKRSKKDGVAGTSKKGASSSARDEAAAWEDDTFSEPDVAFRKRRNIRDGIIAAAILLAVIGAPVVGAAIEAQDQPITPVVGGDVPATSPPTTSELDDDKTQPGTTTPTKPTKPDDSAVVENPDSDTTSPDNPPNEPPDNTSDNPPNNPPNEPASQGTWHEPWDEQVLLRAAYDEQVLISAAWTEQVPHPAEYAPIIYDEDPETGELIPVGGGELINEAWVEDIFHPAVYDTVHHPAEYTTVHHEGYWG